MSSCKNVAKAHGDFGSGHAIVIGVANYRNVSALPEAVLSDARDVAAILSSNSYCGYEPRNVHLLLDRDATRERIMRAFATVTKASGPRDTVVIFFSGHGARVGTSANPRSSLLPFECDGQNVAETSLLEGQFSFALRGLATKRLLVLIDACHSGGAGSFKRPRTGELWDFGYSEKSLGRLAQGTGRVLIASSRASETSWILPNARNSVFTGHLLDALRGQARTTGDGVIRVFEIFNHVAEMVKREVPGRQHPVFKASDLEDNFPVALDGGGVKSDATGPGSVPESDVWSQLQKIMPDLYPTGPTEQDVWARAGGDSSRLHLNDTGRGAWFKALRTLRQGGGGAGIHRVKLIGTVLEDYPHHPALNALL